MLNARQAKIRKIRIKQEKAKREAEGRLASYAKQAWKIVEPARHYTHNWHIDCIGEHLEAVTDREIRNLIINIPPRHMKSLLVSVFWPTWVWGPNKMPSECWLFGSYSPKLATRDSVKARRIIESPWFMENWGRQFFDSDEAWENATSLLRADQNEKMRYENLRAGTRISTTPGGTGTGDGGDIIAVDDPHKVKGIESTVQRESVLEWWDDEMSSRAMEPKRVCKLIIMQRVHGQDLCGHVLEQSDERWEHLCLPMEYEKKLILDMKGTSIFKPKLDDPRREEGELLWKERVGPEEIAEIKAPMTAYQQSGQLQQRPTPREGVLFKRKYFRKRWVPADIEKIVFSEILDTWDLTFADDEKKNLTGKETNKKAFNVGYKLGLCKPNIYVLQECRKQMGIVGQIRELPEFRTRQDHWDQPTKQMLIERAANGQASADLLKQKVPGIVLVSPKGSKNDRAEAQEWLFEGGNIIFPADSVYPWVDEAIEEIVSFGPKATYRDRVDALVHGLEKLSKKMRRVGYDIPTNEKLSGWALG